MGAPPSHVSLLTNPGPPRPRPRRHRRPRRPAWTTTARPGWPPQRPGGAPWPGAARLAGSGSTLSPPRTGRTPGPGRPPCPAGCRHTTARAGWPGRAGRGRSAVGMERCRGRGATGESAHVGRGPPLLAPARVAAASPPRTGCRPPDQTGRVMMSPHRTRAGRRARRQGGRRRGGSFGTTSRPALEGENVLFSASALSPPPAHCFPHLQRQPGRRVGQARPGLHKLGARQL